jgi:predicted RNA polymerase sigma factor
VLAERIDVVRQVLYLMFNEGYAGSGGEHAVRDRADHRGDPADADAARRIRCRAGAIPETAGLLALMLLTDARRAPASEPAS